MITTLTATGPEDLLAAVPLVLGFTPEDSLVMLTFAGAHRFHARLDLPAGPGSSLERELVVSGMLEPALRHQVTRVAFVLYTEDRRLARRLGAALTRAFGEAGIEVVDLLRAAKGRWHPAMDPPTRPSRGEPYDPERHRFRAQAVVAGQITAASRAELAARLAPDDDGAAAVSRLLPQARTLTGAQVAELVRRHLGDGTLLADEELAGLLLAMRDRERRDRGWTGFGRDAALGLIGFWTDVVRRAPPDLVADPAAVLAFAAWLAGNGALAWCALDRCFAVAPDHTLGLLLARALEQAVPPTVWDRAGEPGESADGDRECDEGDGWGQ